MFFISRQNHTRNFKLSATVIFPMPFCKSLVCLKRNRFKFSLIKTSSNTTRLAIADESGCQKLTQDVRLRQPFTELHVARLSWQSVTLPLP